MTDYPPVEPSTSRKIIFGTGAAVLLLLVFVYIILPHYGSAW